jgi:hypothetical protein
MEKHKIKRVVFNILSITSSILVIAIITHFMLMIPFDNKIVGIIVRSIAGAVCYFVTMLVIVLISLLFSNPDTTDFFFATFEFIGGKSKWICHEELGYFILHIDDKEISIHYQGYLYIEKIGKVNNTGTDKYIISNIKSELDKHFYEKLNSIRKEAEKNEQVNSLDNWDGHFNSVTRRDEKINSILK